MAEHEEVTGRSIWRMDRMDDLGGFGLGNFSWQLFGIVSSRIFRIEIDTPKGLSANPLT
jgi:hypothetical protein